MLYITFIQLFFLNFMLDNLENLSHSYLNALNRIEKVPSPELHYNFKDFIFFVADNFVTGLAYLMQL